ncbi:MAG: Ppx/GppA family phosphatase, partial [Bacteroidales bacterium]
MIFAAIDIGSNAVRLLFANVFENTSKQIIFSKASFIRIPLRLGEDVFSEGYIRDSSLAKLIETLQAFKQLIAVYDTKDYCICATAAMREAQNSAAVVQEVFTKTGMKINVIDGLEEANIIRMAGENMPNHSQNIGMYVDVGGGSTEISVTRNNK